MIIEIYKKALNVLVKKPFRLWGISLLGMFLIYVVGIMFGIIPGLALCIGLLLEVAMIMIFLRGYRGEEVTTIQLFECFKDWPTAKRILGGMLWMTLWIVLWSLIPVVGWIFGIIRTYEYRLTPYILVMEPDVSATQAIKVSKQRTEGWKGKMFGADILFYVILFVAILILFALSRIPILGVLFGLANVILVIVAGLFSNLFIGLVQAAFYEEITNGSKICSNCGNVVGTGNAYCPNCGNPINVQAAAATIVEETVVEAAPTEEAPVEEAPVEEKKDEE